MKKVDDDIIAEFHQGGKLLDCVELEYVEGGVTEIELDIDKLSNFDIIGLAKDIKFADVKDFYYLIPVMNLRGV